VTVPVHDGAYDFVVTGPNGFRREFQGRTDFGVDVTTKVDARTRLLRIGLSNTGNTARTFTVGKRTVVVRPGRTVTVVHDTNEAHGWYDAEVACEDFRRRLMGHVENGRPSVSG